MTWPHGSRVGAYKFVHWNELGARKEAQLHGGGPSARSLVRSLEDFLELIAHRGAGLDPLGPGLLVLGKSIHVAPAVVREKRC